MKRWFQSAAAGPVSLEITVEAAGTLRVGLPDDSERRITARRLPGGDMEITEGSRTFRVPLQRDPRTGEITLVWQSGVYPFTPGGNEGVRARSGRGGTARSSGVLTAPMVGVVADVRVAVGDRVEAYQAVAVVEAMKVLATVESPIAGTVRAVHVRKGDRVEHGATLIEVTPEAEGEA